MLAWIGPLCKRKCRRTARPHQNKNAPLILADEPSRNGKPSEVGPGELGEPGEHGHPRPIRGHPHLENQNIRIFRILRDFGFSDIAFSEYGILGAISYSGGSCITIVDVTPKTDILLQVSYRRLKIANVSMCRCIDLTSVLHVSYSCTCKITRVPLSYSRLTCVLQLQL